MGHAQPAGGVENTTSNLVNSSMSNISQKDNIIVTNNYSNILYITGGVEEINKALPGLNFYSTTHQTKAGIPLVPQQKGLIP